MRLLMMSLVMLISIIYCGTVSASCEVPQGAILINESSDIPNNGLQLLPSNTLVIIDGEITYNGTSAIVFSNSSASANTNVTIRGCNGKDTDKLFIPSTHKSQSERGVIHFYPTLGGHTIKDLTIEFENPSTKIAIMNQCDNVTVMNVDIINGGYADLGKITDSHGQSIQGGLRKNLNIVSNGATGNIFITNGVFSLDSNYYYPLDNIVYEDVKVQNMAALTNLEDCNQGKDTIWEGIAIGNCLFNRFHFIANVVGDGTIKYPDQGCGDRINPIKVFVVKGAEFKNSIFEWYGNGYPSDYSNFRGIGEPSALDNEQSEDLLFTNCIFKSDARTWRSDALYARFEGCIFESTGLDPRSSAMECSEQGTTEFHSCLFKANGHAVLLTVEAGWGNPGPSNSSDNRIVKIIGSTFVSKQNKLGVYEYPIRFEYGNTINAKAELYNNIFFDGRTEETYPFIWGENDWVLTIPNNNIFGDIDNDQIIIDWNNFDNSFTSQNLLFVDYAEDNYRLMAGSPAFNKADNTKWNYLLDLDGLARNSTSGAYEYVGAIVGACCLELNVCQIKTQTECHTINGVYEGDGTSCLPNPCMSQEPEDPNNGGQNPPHTPCEPETLYVEVPVEVIVEVPVEVEVPVLVPAQPDTLNMELKLQLVAPEGTYIEIIP